MKSKIDKILRTHFKVLYAGYNKFVRVNEDDFEQASKEIMKLIESERMNVAGAEAADAEIKRVEGLKVSYDEWRKAVDRIRELKSIIKQARANCYSNHKTIMGILDKGLTEGKE